MYKTGDKVRIVNFGHLIWINKNQGINPFKDQEPYAGNETTIWYDINPGLIGKETVITGESNGRYSTELFSWASPKQLEKI